MGTGVYSLDIELPTLQADDWILDLGNVRESARVRINGQEAGCAWAVPYQLKVGPVLKTRKKPHRDRSHESPCESNCRIRQAGSAVAQIQRNQYC